MVKVLAFLHPLRDEQVEAEVADGQSIREIVGDVPVHAWVDGHEVPAELLGKVRPKAGAVLVVRPVPRDGGIIRSVALVAVAAAAVAVTGGALAPLLGASFAVGGLGAIAGGAAIGIGGSLLINQLVPPQLPSLSNSGESFNRLEALTGTSNRTAAFQPIPRLYGTFRFFPPVPMTGLPYTELVGSDQYLRMLLVLGYGPLEVGGVKAGDGGLITEATSLTGTPIRIGETDIAQWEDVEFEIGDPADITLYSNEVIESNPAWVTDVDMSGVDREDDDIWVTDGDTATRTTSVDADEISIDLTFPAGLFGMSSGGKTSYAKVEVKIEYRLVGAGSWTVQANPWTVQSSKRETFRVGRRWKVATGQYEVRLTRIRTFFSEAETTSAQMSWTALRTIRSKKPFVVPNTVVMALRIRATDQLNGRLDNVSVEAASLLQVWNGSAWAEQATRAPAWIYADILTGAANADPLNKADLDTTALLDWATETEADGRYYDGVFDDNSTVFARLQEVATTGRASFGLNGEAKVSVVRDTAQSTPKMVISPRNSFDFSSTISYDKPPHAYRVRFVDPDTYEDTERLVFDDGYNEGNATRYEVLQTKGVKSADQAWKDGRYHLAQIRLRPETFTFSQDVQHLRYRRGDLLTLRHDVILVGLGAGRVTAITTDMSGDVTAFDCDERLYMEAAKSYGVKVQKDDSSIATVGITTVSPYTQSVTLNSPVTGIKVGDHFVFGEAGAESLDVKVSRIEPRGDFIAQVTCVPAAPDVLDAETGSIPDYDPVLTKPIDVNVLPPPVPEITAIRSDETVMFRDTDGSFRLRMMVFARIDSFPGTGAVMQVRVKNQNESAPVWQTSEPQDAGVGVFVFADVHEGDVYDIQARSSRDGRASRWSSTQTHTIVGKTSKPPQVTNLFVQTEADGTRKYSWDVDNQPIDTAGYVIKYVRGTTWTDWDSALPLGQGLITTSPWESNLLPAGDYVVAIKAQDTSGNQSATETTLQVDLGNPRLRSVLVQKVPPVEGWPGTITDAFVNVDNELEAITVGGWANLPDTWAELGDSWAAIGATKDPIEYITEVIDIGRDVTFTPLTTVDAAGNPTVTMKTGTDADGGVTGSFVTPAETTGRYVQLKVSVTNPTGVALIRYIEVLIDSPVVIVSYDDVNTASASANWFESVAAGHFKIATQNNMGAINSAAIRAFQNVGAGWTFELLSKSASVSGNANPAAEFKTYNASGVLADATIDVELKGSEA